MVQERVTGTDQGKRKEPKIPEPLLGAGHHCGHFLHIISFSPSKQSCRVAVINLREIK